MAGTGKWRVGSPISGAAASGTPVVSLRRVYVRIKEIHFATSATGSSDWHHVYLSGNTHPLLPGKSLQWWAKGAKITTPEWANNGRHNRRACFTRNQPVAFRVKLVANTTVARTATLTVTPTLDGSTRHLTAGSVTFTYPANASEHWVTVTLGGQMPDEVGRYILRLSHAVTGGLRFGGPRRTRHRIYGAYGPPLEPEYDSASSADTGRATSRTDGTKTGTKKRLDHLTLLIGGRNRRHVATSQSDLVDLYWKLHVGINDTPGAPPYFDAGHDEHMTDDGTGSGVKIPVEDQWLAFVRNSAHWNDASCIGHVQIAKTMLASVGLFARRTWVFPHTTKLPDGSTVSYSNDEDFYCLGNFDPSKEHSTTIHFDGRTHTVVCKLMEPGDAWENFEACMLSPTGKFLTGGYNPRTQPASFRNNKGFDSARDLLRWWSRTARSGFGRRFLAWVGRHSLTGRHLIFDVDGTNYDWANYTDIRDNGKDLPVP